MDKEGMRKELDGFEIEALREPENGVGRVNTPNLRPTGVPLQAFARTEMNATEKNVVRHFEKTIAEGGGPVNLGVRHSQQK